MQNKRLPSERNNNNYHNKKRKINQQMPETSQSKTAMYEKLPGDILRQIMQYLELSDIRDFRNTCKFFKVEIDANKQLFWKKRLKDYFSFREDLIARQEQIENDLKKVFEDLCKDYFDYSIFPKYMAFWADQDKKALLACYIAAINCVVLGNFTILEKNLIKEVEAIHQNYFSDLSPKIARVAASVVLLAPDKRGYNLYIIAEIIDQRLGNNVWSRLKQVMRLLPLRRLIHKDEKLHEESKHFFERYQVITVYAARKNNKRLVKILFENYEKLPELGKSVKKKNEKLKGYLYSIIRHAGSLEIFDHYLTIVNEKLNQKPALSEYLSYAISNAIEYNSIVFFENIREKLEEVQKNPENMYKKYVDEIITILNNSFSEWPIRVHILNSHNYLNKNPNILGSILKLIELKPEIRKKYLESILTDESSNPWLAMQYLAQTNYKNILKDLLTINSSAEIPLANFPKIFLCILYHFTYNNPYTNLAEFKTSNINEEAHKNRAFVKNVIKFMLVWLEGDTQNKTISLINLLQKFYENMPTTSVKVSFLNMILIAAIYHDKIDFLKLFLALGFSASWRHEQEDYFINVLKKKSTPGQSLLAMRLLIRAGWPIAIIEKIFTAIEFSDKKLYLSHMQNLERLAQDADKKWFNDDRLIRACLLNKGELVEHLLKESVCVRGIKFKDMKQNCQDIPLVIALNNKNSKIIRLLMKHGALIGISKEVREIIRSAILGEDIDTDTNTKNSVGDEISGVCEEILHILENADSKEEMDIDSSSSSSSESEEEMGTSSSSGSSSESEEEMDINNYSGRVLVR